MAAELEKGKEHIRFCIDVYKMQLARHQHFVHEHPAKSKAWQMKEMRH